MKKLISKIGKLGFRLGIKKLLGYEAVFSCALRKREAGKELYEEKGTEQDFTVLPLKNGYWYADPLVYEYDSQEVVFMECVNPNTGFGEIGIVNLTLTNGNWETPEIIISEPFHMSFPMIFEWQDNLYMIPETEMDNGINIYRCERFPDKWVREGKYLQGIKLVDSVVVGKTEDKVEIMASEYNQENDFYTRFQRYEVKRQQDKLFTVEIYKKNTEIYTLESRFAGPVLECGLLPVQRSTRGIYGYSLKFCTRELSNKLKCIKEVKPDEITAFCEKRMKLIGIHTYSCSSHYELIDVQFLKFNKNKWINRLWTKMKRK